jgi:hypothetical protein
MVILPRGQVIQDQPTIFPQREHCTFVIHRICQARIAVMLTLPNILALL